MPYNKLDIGTSDQDKVIITMCCDSDFLSKTIRKRIKAQYFTGEIRQAVVRTIIDFHDQYDKAPVENLLDIIQESIKQKTIRSSDEDAIEEYLLKIYSICDSDVNEKYLTDRLTAFLKKRIANSAITKLQKIQDRVDTNPDKLFSIMRDALADVERSTSKQSIELFSELSESTNYDDEVVTSFGIKELDDFLGGGLKTSNFIVFQGYTGRGKSWAMTHLAKNAAIMGYSSLLVDNERGNRFVKKRLRMSITGKTTKELNDEPELVRKQSKKTLVRKSEIILLAEDEKGMSVDELPAVLVDIKEKTGKDVKLVLLDSADDMEPPKSCKSVQPLERSIATYVWLKNWARDGELAVVSTSQSQRIGETRWWLTSATIGNDFTKVKKCTVGISFNANDKEAKAGYGRILVFKASDGPTGFKCWISNDFKRGQFIADYGPYDRVKYKVMMQELGVF